MLTSLALKNFKKHAETVVNLTPGLNLVTGPNYTGKSTLLQAVRYALEGAAAIPGGKAIATQHGADDHEVTLEFVVNGSDYSVSRSARKATLVRDGKVIAKSASAVTNHLTELLGMPNGLFSKLRYGKQKETEALLTLGAGELQKIIGEVSQVEIVNQVIAKCSATVSECNGGLEALPPVDVEGLQKREEDLRAEMGALHLVLQELVEKINATNASYAVKDAELSSNRELVTSIKAENDERYRLREDSLKLVKQLDSVNAKVGELDGVADQLDQAQTELQKWATIISNYNAKSKVLDNEKENLARVTDQLQRSQEQVDKFTQLKETHADWMDTTPLIDTRNSIDESLAVKNSQLAEAEAAVNSGVCPTCKRPYTHDEDWLKEMGDSILKLKIEVSGLLQEKKQVSDRIKGAELNNTSLDKVAERLVSATQTLDHQAFEKDRLAELVYTLSEEAPCEVLTEAEDRLAEGKQKVSYLNAQALELHTALTQQSVIGGQLQEINSRLQVLGPEKEAPDTEGLWEEVQELKVSLAKMDSEYTPKSHEYTRLSGEYKTIASMIETAKGQMKKRDEMQDRLTTASGLAKYLRSNRDRFMSTVWAGILSQASEFTASCTGGDVTRVDRDEKGNFTYEESGRVLPVQAASGAQRSIMGIGVQLAMATMLPCPLATIMLDEPSADADDEVSLALTTMLSTISDQLLVVSHRAFDGAVAENVITLER
jgi:DNA repair exonuclease SbcCD ATPase subunit